MAYRKRVGAAKLVNGWVRRSGPAERLPLTRNLLLKVGSALSLGRMMVLVLVRVVVPLAGVGMGRPLLARLLSGGAIVTCSLCMSGNEPPFLILCLRHFQIIVFNNTPCTSTACCPCPPVLIECDTKAHKSDRGWCGKRMGGCQMRGQGKAWNESASVGARPAWLAP